VTDGYDMAEIRNFQPLIAS